MNSILRIYIPLTLNVVAQHTEILTAPLLIYQSNLHLMIRSIILLGLRVHANRSREIYYSFDSCSENNKSHSGPVQYVLTLKTYQHIN